MLLTLLLTLVLTLLLRYLHGVFTQTGNTPMNNFEIAKNNELEVLKAIANCGWVSTNMLARWVWCNSNLKTGINKAQQVTKRLISRGEILRRVTISGPSAWVLTEHGAQRLNDSLRQNGFKRGWAHHGYDISTLQYLKQNLIVEQLTKYRTAGYAAVGKAGIRAGLVSAEYRSLDGVVVNISDGYTIGLLFVSDRSPSTQERITTMGRVCPLILIGTTETIQALRTKVNYKAATELSSSR